MGPAAARQSMAPLDAGASRDRCWWQQHREGLTAHNASHQWFLLPDEAAPDRGPRSTPGAIGRYSLVGVAAGSEMLVAAASSPIGWADRAGEGVEWPTA